MSTKNELSRLTIDLPKEAHRRIKRIAANSGRSMRAIILEAIEAIDECPYSHEPNETTIKAINDAKAGKGLVRGKKAEEISKKLGL